MGNAFVFFADGFEEIEALGTVDILRRAGLNVTTVSVTESYIACGAHNVPVNCDEMIDNLYFSKADVLVLPGGMPGAANLSEHEGLNRLIKKCHEEGQVFLAAICAAPMVYGKLGLLDGHKATCYPGFEGYLVGAETTGNMVEQDGRFITGKCPGATFEFAFQIVRALLGEEKVRELKEGIIIK